MTSILEDLHVASYKGATFLIRSGSTSGGRKTIVHEYPNSDRRFVEDLGELRETFTIQGIVHGKNYFNDRDALISALKSEGLGELIHPFFGTLTVVAEPYTLIEDTTTLGVAKFSMLFNRAGESIFPRDSENNASLINNTTIAVLASSENDVGSFFKIPDRFKANFQSAKVVLTSVTDKFETARDTVVAVREKISSFDDSIISFRNDLNGLIFNPLDLAPRITGLFNDFASLSDVPRNQFDILQKLFDFGDDDEPIIRSTLQRIERDNNRNLINNVIKVNALADAFNVVPSLTFNTEDDIKEIQQILDDQFESVVDNNKLLSEDVVQLSGDTIQQIKELRVEVQKFLENEAVNVFKIAEIQTKEISTTILTYQYYGNLDNNQTIIDLNKFKNPTFVSGTVNILTL